jgi:hypothetical protein
MSFQTIAILSVTLFLCLLAVIRTYSRRRWLTLLVLLVPSIVFSIRWARLRAAWLELGIGAGIALLGFMLWWILYGRRLPKPEESSIRVWTQEDPF